MLSGEVATPDFHCGASTAWNCCSVLVCQARIGCAPAVASGAALACGAGLEDSAHAAKGTEAGLRAGSAASLRKVRRLVLSMIGQWLSSALHLRQRFVSMPIAALA